MASPARAYVRARTDDTYIPLFWSDPRKVLELAQPPAGIGITAADLRGAAQAAVASWSHSSIACTGVALSLAREATEDQTAGFDGINRIIMRTGAWCRDPVAMTHCHDPSVLALTTIFSRSRPGAADDGEMMEADIEVNAVAGMQWGIVPTGSYSARDYANTYDLPSVLTHETGHFIGLAHSCLVPNAPLLVDDRGVAIPSCSAIPAAEESLIADATMYPFMDPANITLRSLTPDDARAACEMYPTWSVPDDVWIGAGGCSQAPVPPSHRARQLAFAVGLLLGCAAVWRRGSARRELTRPGRGRAGPA